LVVHYVYVITIDEKIILLHDKNFTEVSKNLTRHRSESLLDHQNN